MNETGGSGLSQILAQHESDLLSDWVSLQSKKLGGTRRVMDERQVREQSRDFLTTLRSALQQADGSNIAGPEWSEARGLLERITHARLAAGMTPSEVATFVFSLKQPVFALIRREYANDATGLAEATWNVSLMIDRLGLYTTEVYQKARNEVIQRQQEEMLELSTPVVKLWEGILALPLIGTLDSARTQIVMQNLLEAVVETGAEIAIIDITGVPTVDTLVAQHLLKTVAAARLMGADCIISGIRPQIAQTIIHLGVDLANVVTKATLAGAFAEALRRSDLMITSRRTGDQQKSAGN
jgi:rsbT co-antagonist protein RsbR